jgi:hypothetical protein
MPPGDLYRLFPGFRAPFAVGFDDRQLQGDWTVSQSMRQSIWYRHPLRQHAVHWKRGSGSALKARQTAR